MIEDFFSLELPKFIYRDVHKLLITNQFEFLKISILQEMSIKFSFIKEVVKVLNNVT